MRRRILFIVYDQFELLDMSGPAAVFSASRLDADEARYEVILTSVQGGPVRTSTGVEVSSRALSTIRISSRDTVLVVGATRRPLQSAMNSLTLRHWLQGPVARAGRVGSVCSGAFLLAGAGILDGRRAATHWAACQELARTYPQIEVDPDALYVTDGRVWTSAGVSTGIDMALAMVEVDLGSRTMMRVARRLVVYALRPGNQSQFSSLLSAQSAGGDAFKDTIAWIDAHLDRAIKVSDMAAQAGMSERTFYRKFTDALGLSPHRYLGRARLDRGRQLLERGLATKRIAAAVGYASTAGFVAAFEARFDVSPALYKRMHASGEN
ncbi:MAG: helix-turn-helix domain-containing protein [Gammaproteobacteria bacterium]|nr:helix-turn-helix domain-containing protein [Gammaproteobacteria bacterium]